MTRETGKATDPWICPTCRAQVRTPHCPTCGERPVLPRDLTLRGVLRQLFRAVSSIDGRLIRSLRTVITRPGALTVAFVEGPRKPYLGPFQIFLIANVAFVAAQSFTGMNVFSSTLDSHLHQQDWRELAQRLVAHRLESTHTSLDAFTPVFNRTAQFLAKSLVILMAIPFSLLASVLFLRARRPFAVHVVFAVHVYSFLLLLFCATLFLVALEVLCGGARLESAGVDNVVSLLNLAACFAYLYVATRAVYGVTGAMRIISSATLAVVVAAIVVAYRFGLFLLALHVA